MPNFDIVKTVDVKPTFRNASVIGMFDLQPDSQTERFVGSMDFPDQWQIGVIVGNSGTGKTTIAREIFGQNNISGGGGIPQQCFDSRRHAHRGNNGANHRGVQFRGIFIAAIVAETIRGVIQRSKDAHRFGVRDSGRSTNDCVRRIHIGRGPHRGANWIIRRTKSHPTHIQTIRGRHVPFRRHSVVDARLDIRYQRHDIPRDVSKKKRPDIRVEIFQTRDKSIWRVFAKHHYLNHSFNRSSDTFVMYVNGELCGFTSTLRFVHPKVKNTKRGHRTVILPDFQGVGLGVYLRDFVAEHYRQRGIAYITTTSNPALVHSMKHSPKWICTAAGRNTSSANANKGSAGNSLNKTIAGVSRITTSWRYVGDKQ